MSAPVQPVMYRCFDAAGRLVYVGSTADWNRRLSEHRKQSWWFSLIADIKARHYPTLEDARRAESKLLRKERPTFNWRDTGRSWLGRRDDWTAADHALHKRWFAERGEEPPRLCPPIRAGSVAARAAARRAAGESYYVAS